MENIIGFVLGFLGMFAILYFGYSYWKSERENRRDEIIEAIKKERAALEFEVFDFAECSVCAVKSGTPVLCRSCIQNRTAIEKLKSKIREGRKER